MTAPITNYDGWIDTDAVDINGDKIGGVDQIYYDDVTGRPEWLAIKTGFFGSNTTFVPIAGATTYTDDRGDQHLQLPYSAQMIKDAPNVDPYGDHLSASEEEMLFKYYGYDYAGTERYGETDRFDTGYEVSQPASMGTGTTTADATSRVGEQVVDETELVNTEERPIVGKEQVETGKVRLRKYVIREEKTVKVPTERTEVRVERE